MENCSSLNDLLKTGQAMDVSDAWSAVIESCKKTDVKMTGAQARGRTNQRQSCNKRQESKLQWRSISIPKGQPVVSVVVSTHTNSVPGKGLKVSQVWNNEPLCTGLPQDQNWMSGQHGQHQAGRNNPTRVWVHLPTILGAVSARDVKRPHVKVWWTLAHMSISWQRRTMSDTRTHPHTLIRRVQYRDKSILVREASIALWQIPLEDITWGLQCG